jgi:phosphatidylglycerophosphatase GEP4
MNHFLNQTPPRVTHPNQIVVIGDRMLTDVMLGSFMGSWTIWLQKGVIPVNDSVRQHLIKLIKS